MKENETKMYVVNCSAVITGEDETKQSALETFREEIARGNYEITVNEVKDSVDDYHAQSWDESYKKSLKTFTRNGGSKVYEN
tara:strand:+ start:107 stop:352 length:246 start_codon:yes stop_codon:yes gene_type:complete